MDSVSDAGVKGAVLKCSAQVGKTEVINNIIGFHVDQDPSPILVIMPTLELAEAWSKDRLAPMLRDTPCLRGKVKDPRSRDSGNSLLRKTFPGGHITAAGANAPASLSSRPIRIVLCDERNRFPVSAGTEGDPVAISKKRLATFWNGKWFLSSSPTLEGVGIDVDYEKSDQRLFYVPCPSCGKEQSLCGLTKAETWEKWQRVHWKSGQPETATYDCEFCDAKWDDAKRWRAIRRGRWKAHKPFKGVAGFHLNELYSSWVRLPDMVQEFLESKDHPERFKVWINTALGESWQVPGEAPDWKRLYDRREAYKIGKVPRGALFVTGSGDVQKDRIEIQIIGWGRGKQNWSVAYIVLDGDPYRPEVWKNLTELISSQFPSEYGQEFILSRFAIDSGYATQEVYGWARQQAPGRVLVYKGNDHRLGAPIGQPSAVDVNYGGKKIARGIKVWPVAVNIFKSELYGWLNLESPTVESGVPFSPGYCHQPQYEEEFFKQITAEQLVPRVYRGYIKHEWQKTRQRNEALDTWVGNRFAASVVGIDRFTENHWAKLEADLGVTPLLPSQNPKPVESLPRPAPTPGPVAPIAQHRPSGWLGGNRSGWLNKR